MINSIRSSPIELSPQIKAKMKYAVRKQQFLIDTQPDFQPQITNHAKKLSRGFDPLIEDANRRIRDQSAQQDLSKCKIASNVNLISLNSDKVLYERFDKDFTEATIKLNIIKKTEMELIGNTNLLDKHISCPQMSQLFLELGFISSRIMNKE